MKRTQYLILTFVIIPMFAAGLTACIIKPLWLNRTKASLADERAAALSVKMDALVATAYAMADANGVIPGFCEGIDITLDGRVSNDLVITAQNSVEDGYLSTLQELMSAGILVLNDKDSDSIILTAQSGYIEDNNEAKE